jgi:hypothetical protein
VFFGAISRFPLQADVWPPFSGGLGEGVAQDAGFMSFGVVVRHRELGRQPGCILQRDRAKGGFGEGGEMGLSGYNVWQEIFSRAGKWSAQKVPAGGSAGLPPGGDWIDLTFATLQVHSLEVLASNIVGGKSPSPHRPKNKAVNRANPRQLALWGCFWRF